VVELFLAAEDGQDGGLLALVLALHQEVDQVQVSRDLKRE